MAKGIFVSYRRDDAAHATGRIADALAARFGKDRVFVDVDSVALGEDFVRKIDSTIENADTFLAVIGPNWLSAQTPSGDRRIDTPSDFIRMEVLAALRSNLQIIPVLVDGASMPRAEDLPPDLAQLVRHNAIHVEHNSFTRDMTRLLAQLSPPKLIERVLSPRVLAGIAAIAALAALLVSLLLPNPAPEIGDVTTTIVLADQSDSGFSMQNDIQTISQVAERGLDDKLTIRSHLPYLERLQAEARIDGLLYRSAAFRGGLPKLTVQVTNSTDQAINVTELNFEIASTIPNLTAIPVLQDDVSQPHQISYSNQGWGEMRNSRLVVRALGSSLGNSAVLAPAWRGAALKHEPCRDSVLELEFDSPAMFDLSDSARGELVDISSIVPADFRPDWPKFCVIGDLTYDDMNGDGHIIEFRTRVSNETSRNLRGATSARPAYDLKLDFGRDGYVEVVPAAREIAPNETAVFTLEVLLERSASFELTHRVRLADDRVIEGQPFSLDLIYPRTRTPRYRLRDERRFSVSPEILRQFDPERGIETFEYDPNGREGSRIMISDNYSIDDCVAYGESVVKPLLAAVNAKSEVYYIGRESGILPC